jgi:hypothetical protein
MSDNQSSKDVFHITVGTSPQTHGGINLQSELRLLKAALLYADRVKFCSLSSSLLISLLQLGQLSGEDILRVVAQGLNNPDLDAALAFYDKLKRKKRRNKQELITARQLTAKLRNFQEEARSRLEKSARQAGIEHLEAAIKTGVVELQIFQGADFEQLTYEYFDAVSAAVLSGKTYPLFDDHTGELIQYAVREGRLKPSKVSVNRAKQVGLSSDLLHRLPLFDNTPVNEIIDIRKELDASLRRFRSAVVKFSRDVENAAWDKEFPLEAEQVFREHVEPAVLEIEEACRSNKLIFSLLPSLVDKPSVPLTTSVLGLLLAEASQMPYVFAAGLAAGTATVALRSVQEWREKQKQTESNHLFFYYKAGEMLQSL